MCPPEEVLRKPTRRVRSLVGAEIKRGESKAGNFGFVLTFPHQEALELRANTADEQVEWIERLKYSIAEANKSKDRTKGSWTVSHVVSQWSDSDWEDEDSADKIGQYSPILQRNRTKENPDDRLRLKGERIVRFSRFLTMNENATKPFEAVWEKILWGIDILHQIVDLETITSKSGKHAGIDKRLHVALFSLCKYLIDRGNETRVRVELEKMFRVYLMTGKDFENKSQQYRGNMRQVMIMLNTWEKYKILQECVRRAFNAIDKNLANLSREGDAKSVSALAIRVYMKMMVHDDKKLKQFCEPAFETLDKFRQDSSKLDVTSSRVIRNLCELFLILGITENSDFNRIESFVDVLRANNGQFVVKSEFSLIPDPTTLKGFERTLKRDEQSIQIYLTQFEPKYLVSLERSCKRRVADRLSWGETLDLAEYLNWVERNVTWENDMVMRYLHKSTAEKARALIWQNMLLKPQTKIFSLSGPSVLSMFQEMDIKTLSLLYRLYVVFEYHEKSLWDIPTNMYTRMYQTLTYTQVH